MAPGGSAQLTFLSVFHLQLTHQHARQEGGEGEEFKHSLSLYATETMISAGWDTSPSLGGLLSNINCQ